MKNLRTTPVLLLWLIWSAASAFMFHKFCGSSTPEVVEDIKDPTEINVGENSEIVSNVKTSFNESEFQFSSLSKDLSNRIDAYLNELKSSSKKNIIITALYGANEKNTGIFTDLGLARANNIKQLFVQQGIDASRIGIKSKKVNSDKKEEFTKLEFNYTDKIERDGSLEDYKVLFEHEPIILYFRSKSDKLDLSSDQREAFKDLLGYMDLDPLVKIKVSGHTDATGERGPNLKLSEKRALQVRNILISNGMNPSRMIVKGYGPDRALATNKTAEGRSKNRRVEITVQ